MSEDKRTIACKNCGAKVSLADSLCRYCNTPIESNRDLSDTDKRMLLSVINAMEEALKSSAENSWLTGISFLILSGIAVALYFIYTSVFSATLHILLLSLFSTAILFIFFGFIISVSENRSYRNSYNNDIKVRIGEYLKDKNYSRYQFDILADHELPPKAILRRFLFLK